MDQFNNKKNCIKQFIITDTCTKCACCKRICGVKAIEKIDKKFVIDQSLCVKCGACLKNCPIKAIVISETTV